MPPLLLLLLLLLLAPSALCQDPRSLHALPMGVWTASPNLPVKYTGESNAVLLVLNATLDVIDGGSFKYYGTYRQSSNGALISARFTGKAVCADGYIDRVLLSIDGKSCWEAGGASWFCDSAPALYAGVFSYGVSAEGGLILNGWGGAQWPFQFSCASQSPSPPCQYATSCNSTVLNNWQLMLYGGTSIVNGTSQTVVISGGDNSTVIFEGDTINIQNSQFTLEQPTSVNQTTINISPEGNTYPTNTTVIIQPQDATYYEFNTNEAASCSGFAQLDGVKTSNVTLSTAANTRITFDSSSLESPSDWSLSPDSSTIQFNSDSGYAYSLQVCLQSALLYSPSPLGQRLLVYLYNRTGGSPSAISLPATSAVIYNHTNPAFLGGLCTGPILVSRVFNGNRFAVYATIQFTDFSSGTLVLGPSAWTLTASPVACVGTEINIDITAKFNDSQLVAGECAAVDYPDSKTVRVSFVNNLCECASCNEESGKMEAPEGIETPEISSPTGNLTIDAEINVEKVCSETQCNSKPDPPGNTEGIFITRRICFGCGTGNNGGSSNDGERSPNDPDGSNTLLPFVPFFPFVPFAPFFAPFVPFFPIAGSMSGGPGAVPTAGPPGALPSPVPFVTILSPGATPNTNGGMWIPYVNFTSDTKYCGVETRGWAVVDSSSLPHTFYICKATLNGTYAWTPIPGSAFTSDYAQTFANTSQVYTQASTIYISNSSQQWTDGNAYFGGNTSVRNVSVSQSLALPTYNSTEQGSYLIPTALYPILADLKPHLFWDNGTSQLLSCIGFVDPTFAAQCQPLKPVDTYTNNADITFTYTGRNDPGALGTELEAALTPKPGLPSSGACGPLCNLVIDSKGRINSYSNSSTLPATLGPITTPSVSGPSGAAVAFPDGLSTPKNIAATNGSYYTVLADNIVSRDTIFHSPPSFPDGLYSPGPVTVVGATTLGALTACDITQCTGANMAIVAPSLTVNDQYYADAEWKIVELEYPYVAFTDDDIIPIPTSQPNYYILRLFYNDSGTVAALNGARQIGGPET